MKMKKCLVILLCTLLFGVSNIEARTTVKTGVNISGVAHNKNKVKIDDKNKWKFTGTNTFMFGLNLGADYELNQNLLVGAFADFLFGNKKQAYKTDADATALDTLATSSLDNLKIKINDADLAAKDVFAVLKAVNDNKDLFHKKIKNLIIFDLTFGYQINRNCAIKIGVGYARLNAKYKFKKEAAVVGDFAGATNAAKSVALYNAIAKDPTMLVKKIKKNGVDIRGIVCYSIANNVEASAHVGYICGIKAFHYGLKVSYLFNI